MVENTPEPNFLKDCSAALLFISLADILYQRWKYTHDLMMSLDDVKQEHRDTEGAPEIKSRIW
jgi:flagellar biosynthetic protein FlhB